jgi:hypothetical protein
LEDKNRKLEDQLRKEIDGRTVIERELNKYKSESEQLSNKIEEGKAYVKKIL